MQQSQPEARIYTRVDGDLKEEFRKACEAMKVPDNTVSVGLYRWFLRQGRMTQLAIIEVAPQTPAVEREMVRELRAHRKKG